MSVKRKDEEREGEERGGGEVRWGGEAGEERMGLECKGG